MSKFLLNIYFIFLIKAEKDTLLNLVNELDDKVGLIHQIPFVCDSFGFSNALEKVDYGSAVFRKFLFINSVIVRLKGKLSYLILRKYYRKLDKCVLRSTLYVWIFIFTSETSTR